MVICTLQTKKTHILTHTPPTLSPPSLEKKKMSIYRNFVLPPSHPGWMGDEMWMARTAESFIYLFISFLSFGKFYVLKRIDLPTKPCDQGPLYYST